jgi:hypothetical protein
MRSNPRIFIFKNAKRPENTAFAVHSCPSETLRWNDYIAAFLQPSKLFWKRRQDILYAFPHSSYYYKKPIMGCRKVGYPYFDKFAANFDDEPSIYKGF